MCAELLLLLQYLQVVCMYCSSQIAVPNLFVADGAAFQRPVVRRARVGIKVGYPLTVSF